MAVSKALDRLVQEDRGRLLAALILRIRNFQLAEDALQDALISAMSHWSRSGLPRKPDAWLLKAAYRKAIDRIRRDQTAGRTAASLAVISNEADQLEDLDDFRDERLRLIFTCCHPAIEQKSQVALTLRTVAGFSTAQIATAFLDQEATMGQRLSRAKGKIAAAGIAYCVPERPDWPARLNAVLSGIYLIFNAGYTAGPLPGRDLAEDALFLADLLNSLNPEDPEIEGCLALLMISHARRLARVNDDGVTVPLSQQDRRLWKHEEISRGVGLLEQALSRASIGPYQLKAAIAACHCEGPASDWHQIVLLYDRLMVFEPSPVVRLNRAVALGEMGNQTLALAELAALADDLEDYQPFHAARADLLARTGAISAAYHAYDQAIGLAASQADALFLKARQAALPVSLRG